MEGWKVEGYCEMPMVRLSRAMAAPLANTKNVADIVAIRARRANIPVLPVIAAFGAAVAEKCNGWATASNCFPWPQLPVISAA